MLISPIFAFNPVRRFGSMPGVLKSGRFMEQGKNGELILRVNVKPGAKKTQVVGEMEGCLSVQVSAPPREGECNKALVEYVAEILKLKKSNVLLTFGHKSRDKILTLNGIEIDEAEKLFLNSINS